MIANSGCKCAHIVLRAGRRLILRKKNALDLALCVSRESLAHRLSIDLRAPRGFNRFDRAAPCFCNVGKTLTEYADRARENEVARRKAIRNGGFQAAGSRTAVEQDITARAKDWLHAAFEAS